MSDNAVRDTEDGLPPVTADEEAAAVFGGEAGSDHPDNLKPGDSPVDGRQVDENAEAGAVEPSAAATNAAGLPSLAELDALTAGVDADDTGDDAPNTDESTAATAAAEGGVS